MAVFVPNNFLRADQLGEAPAGITRRVITHGLFDLSEKQPDVFKTYGVDEWLMQKFKFGNHLNDRYRSHSRL